jgi:hypothetical protein
MAWSTALSDLRTLLADTASHNLVKDRLVLGNTSLGTNRTFYTFDDRLLASGYQDVCGSPLRVFWDAGSGSGVELAASGTLVTDPIRGEFQTMFVPSGQGRLTASYHFQQSLDTELNTFLQQAALQVSAQTPNDVPNGMQMAAMQIAASMAHTALAQRWQQRKSEQFMLQDLPARQEAEELIKFHQAEATRLLNDGMAIRLAYYDGRQDRGKAPAFGILARTPQPYTPRR